MSRKKKSFELNFGKKRFNFVLSLVNDPFLTFLMVPESIQPKLETIQMRNSNSVKKKITRQNTNLIVK